jgi:hypothetical protein
MMKKMSRAARQDPELLTTDELLAEHERVFGPLEPQAKRRIERAAEAGRLRVSWDGMDGLAA